MKQIVFFAALFICFNANSQAIKRLADRAKQKVENVAGNKVDGAIDNATNGPKKSTGNNKAGNDNDGDVEETTTTSKAAPASLQAYSKYDFVPGEKTIIYENFERTAVGDFPTNWNTDASAEVVTLSGKEGKWLKINTRGTFFPEFIKGIPENSTLEFDLGSSNDYSWSSSRLYVYIASLEDKNRFTSTGYYGKYLSIDLHPIAGEQHKNGGVHFHTGNSTSKIDNNSNIKNWDNKTNLFAHVSLWRQGQRLRMYVNGDKVLDLPRAFDADGKYSDLIFHTTSIQQSQGDYLVLNNIRLATGAPDTRNKLVTEGKWVTTGILFDVNSDKIKSESYGTLKEIAGVLKDNPTIKVKIVGHTDSDGDDKANLELSKKRATAVKAALIKEFSISEDNLETDGKGESEPVDKNTTSEGKANNRRVEFIKI
jgi:OmpA-OmpF porin, OOP family